MSGPELRADRWAVLPKAAFGRPCMALTVLIADDLRPNTSTLYSRIPFCDTAAALSYTLVRGCAVARTRSYVPSTSLPSTRRETKGAAPSLRSIWMRVTCGIAAARELSNAARAWTAQRLTGPSR
jgi:hypothetical protein